MTYFNCHLQNKIISFLSSLAERKEYPIALEKDNNDFLYATVVGRQVDDTGRKYVSVSMNGKLYHYPSDELFAEHPDFPIEKFTSGASKKKIFDFEKAEVDDAITTIRNFIFPER